MTEQFPAYNDFPNGFSGKYVNIQLANDDSLTEQLEARDRLRTYLNIHDEDTLPLPARRVRLESWYDSSSEMLRMEAEISVRPTSLEVRSPSTWPGVFLEEIDTALQHYNYETTRIEHDDRALYISLDLTTSIRVALTSTATECAVDIELESSHEIEDATHATLPEPYADRELSDLERLRHITTTLGIVIDSLREFYGKPPKHFDQYTLKQYTLSKELVAIDADAAVKGKPDSSEYSVVDDNERVLLDSVGGAAYAKQRLTELAAIMNDPEAAAKFDIHPAHFMLHGPPGTGKTTLINAFANEINATPWFISSSDLVEKWVGSSGRNLTETFDKAKATSGNLVLFFDEFDALAHRQGSGGGERTDIRKLLNTELETLAKNYPNIIVAAATNVGLDELEPSLIRSGRMEPIAVPLPTEQERFDIFGVILYESIRKAVHENELVFDDNGEYVSPDGFSLYDTSIDLRDVAAKTDGMTGADFKQLLLRARKQKFTHYRATGQLQSITHQDVLREIARFGR